MLLQAGVTDSYYYDNYLLIDKYANANNPEGNTASVRNVRSRIADCFYYKVVAVKKYQSDDATYGPEERVAEGQYSNPAAVMADNEYSKRLGIKDYLGYFENPFGAGTAYVEQSKGNLVYSETDANIKGKQLDISLDRVYNSMATSKSPFGYSWDMSLNPILLETYDAYGDNTGLVFKDGTGTIYSFLNIPEEYGKKIIDNETDNGSVVEKIETHYKSPLGVYIHLKKVETIVHEDNIGDAPESVTVSYIAETTEGEKYTFNASSQLVNYQDANGNEITYTYDDKGRIEGAENLNGKTLEEIERTPETKRSRITFEYQESETGDPYLVDTAIMPNGTEVKYEYNNGYLSSSTIKDEEESLIRTEYSYNRQNYLRQVKDPNGEDWLVGYTQIESTDTTGLEDEEVLDYKGICRTLVFPNGDGRKYKYHPSEAEDTLVDQTDEISFVRTSALGLTQNTGITRVWFNADGNITRSEDAEGSVVESEYMMGLLVSSTGNVTSYELDDDGYVNVNESNVVKAKTVYDVIPDNNTLAGKIGDSRGNIKKETDIEGNETRIKYEAEGTANQSNPTSIVMVPENGKATHESFTYDDKGNLLTAIDNDTGDAVTYTYGESGEVLTETFSNGEAEESKTTYTYDEAGNIVSEAETGDGIASGTDRYRYDDFGNVTKELNANGYALEHVYDILGRETETRYYTIKTTSIDNLDSTGSLSETRAYDPNGNLVSETDREGRTTTYQYDSINRIESKTITDGSTSKTWQYSYGVESSVDTFFESGTVHVTYPVTETVTSPDGDVLSKAYRDKAGNVVKLIDNGISTSFKYNKDGEIIEMFVVGMQNGIPGSEPSEVSPSNGETVLANYNKYGDNTSIIVNPVWDEAAGKYRVGDDTIVNSYEYDSMGNVLSSQDPLGHKRSFRYDNSGRVERTVTASGDSAFETAVTRLQYDIAGEVGGNVITRITNAENQISETEEDASGNTVRITDYGYRRDSRKIETTFAFDALGNMTSETDANGTTYYSYDDMNNITRKVTAGTIDNPVDYSDYTYDYEGMMTSRKDYSEGTLYNVALFEYDYLKRLRKFYEGEEPSVTSNGSYVNVSWIEYEYDIEDNLSEVIYPSMTDIDSVEYTYGDFKRVDEVRVTDNGIERLARKYGYDPNGRVAYVKDYVANTDYLQKDYLYDSVGRCTGIKVTENGNQNKVLENYRYVYDNCSNIVSEEMMNKGGETNSDTADSDDDSDPDIRGRIRGNGSYFIRREYTYNELNELTECNEFDIEDDGAETLAHTTSYEFDRIGNRTAEISDGVRTEYAYDEDGLNLLVSSSTEGGNSSSENSTVTYSYDNAGNLTEVQDTASEKTTVYQYNSLGMMSRAEVTTGSGDTEETTVSENIYNGEGNRIAKKESGRITHYVSVAGTVLFTYVTEEGSESATVTSENVVGVDGQVFLTKRPGDSWYVYSNDLRGSVTAIADGSCIYVQTCVYDIYGEPEIWRSESGDIYNEIYYTGAIYDETTGLYYLSSRYYNADIGRFTTMDSVRGDVNNPLSLNLYGYCEGNPIRYTDEAGENPMLLGAAVGFATGFGGEILGQVIAGEKINIKKALVSGAIGGVTGALSFTSVKYLEYAADLAGNFVEEVVQRKMEGKKVTVKECGMIALKSVASTSTGCVFSKKIFRRAKKEQFDTIEDIKNVKKVVKEYKRARKTVAKMLKKEGRKKVKKKPGFKALRKAEKVAKRSIPIIKRRIVSEVKKTALSSIANKVVWTLFSKRPKVKRYFQFGFRRR